MILKGSQRSGAKALAVHLLRTDENDHVELHEVSGFCTDDLTEALKEIQAVAKGTRCRQPLFSVSFNPPGSAAVSDAAFVAAIDKVAEATGLSGQPRAIVFHEKDGRRHAHCVWSRIDAVTMRAINLDYTRQRLRKVSQALFLEHGWTLPQGMIDQAPKSALTYSLAEWQEAKRRGIHAGDQKALIQQSWAAADNRAAFEQALGQRGYRLARGDRRGFVIVSPEGQVMAVARSLGKRTKEVAARLGDPKDYAPVAEVRQAMKTDMRRAFTRLAKEVRGQFGRNRTGLNARRAKMIARHRAERALLQTEQAKRRDAEAAARKALLKTGLGGLWQWMTGQRARLQRSHAQEYLKASARDRDQMDAHRQAQLRERRVIEAQRIAARQAAFGIVQELKQEFREMFKDDAPAATRRQRRRRADPGHMPQP
ncbi:relaxase/mobilization nuclease domain-containing protein [Mesobacterium pallidum]|uniref:relaxase/mobilization nuclease domain-containing protein n=1 Tax=Mesobacterium pallidum TaxID=2872037 RepID=UPI001EE19B88|nr:relaxase/mobilization nuclease domain-containing protein [Mesobacterium pallidum]